MELFGVYFLPNKIKQNIGIYFVKNLTTNVLNFGLYVYFSFYYETTKIDFKLLNIPICIERT